MIIILGLNTHVCVHACVRVLKGRRIILLAVQMR